MHLPFAGTNGSEGIFYYVTVYSSNAMHAIVAQDSGHNGHKPNRPKPKRPQTETATDRNGQKLKRQQTGTATDRNSHKPKRPQTGTATDQSGHKPKRPQTVTATNRNRQNCIWFSGLQIFALNRSFKIVLRSRQK